MSYISISHNIQFIENAGLPLEVFSNTELWIPILLPPNCEGSDTLNWLIKSQVDTSHIPKFNIDEYWLWNVARCRNDFVFDRSCAGWSSSRFFRDDNQVSTWYQRECQNYNPIFRDREELLRPNEIEVLKGYQYEVDYISSKGPRRKKRVIYWRHPGCSKMFIKAWNFLDHARMHLGEKPFQWTEWNSKFTQKGNLMKHMKKHQLKEI